MKKQQGQKSKQFKTIRTILNITFMSGLILNVFSVLLFEDTIIDWYLPILANLCMSIILLPITSKILDRYYGKQNIFYKLAYNVGSVSAIIIYCFMALNYYLADTKQILHHADIEETGTLGKGRHSNCRQPYAYITYEGNRKRLIYPCGTNIKKNSQVKLITRKGLLGYDIITGKTLQ